MQTAAIDETEVVSFLGRVVDDIGGAATVAMVCLGEELGLYRAMAGAGGVTAGELAAATGCHERLVREWLEQQAAAGYVRRRADHESTRFELPVEHAMVVAEPSSPAFVAAGQWTLASMYRDLDAVAEAFRTDGRLAWGDHDPCLFHGVAEWFRPSYEANLATTWIPALDGIDQRLSAGGSVADVGCGHGHASMAVAAGFPDARVSGFDQHQASVDAARERATQLELGGRVHFDVAHATGYDGSYDLVLFGDCLHDMGDPVGAARHALARLVDGGSVMVVEPLATDDSAVGGADGWSPIAKIFYAASTCICTPNALAQDGDRALGAQAGESAMAEVFESAGATSFRRVAETPFNAVYEARP